MLYALSSSSSFVFFSKQLGILASVSLCWILFYYFVDWNRSPAHGLWSECTGRRKYLHSSRAWNDTRETFVLLAMSYLQIFLDKTARQSSDHLKLRRLTFIEVRDFSFLPLVFLQCKFLALVLPVMVLADCFGAFTSMSSEIFRLTHLALEKLNCQVPFILENVHFHSFFDHI